MKNKKFISTLCGLFAVATLGGSVALWNNTVEASASETPDKYEFAMVEGSSNSVEGGAMRFGATMSTSDYNALIAKGASFGMVIAPADYVYVNAEALTHSDSSVYATSGYELTEENVWTNKYFSANPTGEQKQIIDETATVDVDDSIVTMYGAITNIRVSNYTRSFVGRAYYVVDGVYTFADYADGSIENNTRCMYYVAQKAVEAGDFKEIVQEKYINAYNAYKPDAQYKYFVDIYVDGEKTETQVFGGTLNGTATTAGVEGYVGADVDETKESVVEATVYPAGKTRLSVYYNSTDVFVKKLTGDFIYRVGNANAVQLGSLFAATEGVAAGDITTVSVTTKSRSATYTANDVWTKSTLQFSTTGVLEVTITSDNNKAAKPVSLILEVVDGTNVTTYSELKNQNSVLLNDITMSSGGSYYLSGATLYGNGFTFDMSQGTHAAGGNTSSNYVFGLNNATIDNVKVVGEVYTKYGATVQEEYNRAAILALGNSAIINSYVSNCASAVRSGGSSLEIINSTIKGGNFANIDIRNGHVVLDNVTTINQVNGNDTAAEGTVVVGLGVVVYYENVLNTTTIEIKNGITQYNYLSKSQADTYIKDDQAKILTKAMFDSQHSAVQYSSGSDTWVNAGIISMTETVGDSNISDVDEYVSANPSMLGTTGYLHTKKPDATSITATAPAYATAGQGAIAPSYSFDHTKNYAAKADGSNDYCYEENGTVYLSMDEGDTFDWDTSILTATKAGETLDYTVSMNGTDYTGKAIAFDTAGNYTVNYTYTDSNNYTLVDGEVDKYEKTYTKSVHISVAVIAPETKHAEFTMGSSNQATERITVGNKTYISATGVSHDNSKWSYITVDGTQIYYPIIEAKIVDKKLAYFYVFNGAVAITDYADAGTGSEILYNASTATTEMPKGLTVVKGRYGKFTDFSSNWSTLKDSDLTTTDEKNSAGAVFRYAAAATSYATLTTYGGYLAYVSPEVTNAREEYLTIAQYSYTDATNTTYYYYVGYHMAEKGDACVTPDTLITLADGTQKRVDCLTGNEELLVWNLETGMLGSAPIMFIDSEELDSYEIIKLAFSDGTEVKVIYEHGFWDYDLNRYVYLDENASAYIGHTFAKQNGEELAKVQLVSVSIETEATTAWSPVTQGHLCYFVNGMLSMPGGVGGLFNIFDVDAETMTYDFEAMQADIEKYGLFTYEELSSYVELSEEMFNQAGGAYLKISIGKGNLTMEELIAMIERYTVHFEQ